MFWEWLQVDLLIFYREDGTDAYIDPIYAAAIVTGVRSDFDPNFIYRVRETVTVDDFDDNRFNECAPRYSFLYE